MTMSETVLTAGPVDPNAGTRVKVYGGVALVFGIVTAAQAFHLISADQAVSVKDFIDSGLGVAGAFGFGFVAKKTNKQVENGTFDKAPTNPVQDAFESISAIQDAITSAVDASTAKVNEGIAIIQGATALPGLGQVFSGPVGDLIQAVQDRATGAAGQSR